MTKRNQPCPCGSNIKYKKCCGKSTGEVTASAPNEEPQNQIKTDIPETNRTIGFVDNQDESEQVSPQKYYEQGCKRLKQGKLEDAVACFKKALALQPAAEVYYNLATIQEKLGEFTDAIESFQKALHLKPELAIAHFSLGTLYLRSEKHEKAIEHFKKAIAEGQNQAELYNSLGVAQNSTGLQKEAEESFKKALSIDGNYAETYVNLGVIFRKQGNSDEAIEYLKKALSLDNSLSEAYLNLGKIYKSQGREDQANDYFTKALSSLPISPQTTDPLFVNKLATLYQEQEKFDEAIDCYTRFLDAEPDNAIVLNDLGVLYSKKGLYQKAKDCFLKSNSINPNYHKPLNEQGVISLHEKDYQDAVEYFKKSLSLEPIQPNTLTNLGTAYVNLRRFDEAADCFLEALAINPSFDRAIFNQGFAYQMQGKYHEAEQYYRKALSNSEIDAETLCQLGSVLHAQGDEGEAISSYQKALAIKPDYPRPHVCLAIIYWSNGDWHACKSHVDRLQDLKHKFETKTSYNKFERVYFSYLSKLLKYKENNSLQYPTERKLPIIYAVGDSHCLSIANTKINYKGKDFLANSKIVIGCKAWHLSNAEENLFKYEFRKVIETIPIGATAIFMFGEIDCRIEEGIIKHYKKNKVDLDESINLLVAGYFKFILDEISPKNISPIICNVHTHNYEQTENYELSESDKTLQKKVLNIFNQSISEYANKNNIPILDLYTFTKEEEYKSNSEYCHIDGNHLYPWVYRKLLPTI